MLDRTAAAHTRSLVVLRKAVNVSRNTVILTAAATVSLYLATGALAQKPKMSNVDLCNGKNVAATSQIAGCSAIIKASGDNPAVLAIAHNNRGNAFSATGDYELAITDYDESIKQNPTYAKPFNNRGVAYQKKGQYDRAMEDFNAAINIDPNYADAFANRGETHQLQGDYADAVKDFTEAIRLKPDTAVVWSERCWARAIVGELQSALADCNQAIKLEPNAASFDSRGLTHLKLGELDAAVADYNFALQRNPKMASAQYGRGLARLKKGDRAGGSADIKAAKTLDKNIASEFASFGL